MPLCDQCECQYSNELATDICPNCGERLRRCPWCGETLPWSFPGRATPCCTRPLKYVRTHGPDVPLLTRGEGIEGGPVFLRVEAAVYHGGNSTVYRVAPAKRLGDPFLLDGTSPPPLLCLKEIVADANATDGALAPDLVERLLRLRHPNVVRLYASWTDGDRAFLLLDWLPGETAAARYLKAGKPAPAAVLRRIAQEALDGLAAMGAPDVGLLHGDVTPFNLAFDAEDRPVLIDLGSAQPIASARLPKELTPHYAPLEFYPVDQRPPEYGDRPDLAPGEASDRYMLGATLYALACGQDATVPHPETGLPILVSAPERAKGVAQARLGAVRPDLPRAFTVWVDDLMNLLPAERFASHDAARKALRSGARAVDRTAEKRPKPGVPPGVKWGQLDARPAPVTERTRLTLAPRVALPLGVLVAALLLAWRYPSTLVHPWRWPRLVEADAALHLGRPESVLESLRSAGPTDWDAQILMARAQLRLGAPKNALARLQGAAARDDAPAYVKRAYRSIAQEAGAQELAAGLRLMERGDRYPAFVHLQEASRLGVSSFKADEALVRLYRERGDLGQAQAAVERCLNARPRSIWGRLTASDLDLARGSWQSAQAQALRARQLAAQPPDRQVDPVAPEALNRGLARIASALAAGIPASPRHSARASSLQESIERLAGARNLRPSAPLDLQIARYYERLGDVSPRAEGVGYYGKACDILRNSRARYGANAAVASLLARCEGKAESFSRG